MTGYAASAVSSKSTLKTRHPLQACSSPQIDLHQAYAAACPPECHPRAARCSFLQASAQKAVGNHSQDQAHTGKCFWSLPTAWQRWVFIPWTSFLTSMCCKALCANWWQKPPVAPTSKRSSFPAKGTAHCFGSGSRAVTPTSPARTPRRSFASGVSAYARTTDSSAAADSSGGHGQVKNRQQTGASRWKECRWRTAHFGHCTTIT